MNFSEADTIGVNLAKAIDNLAFNYLSPRSHIDEEPMQRLGLVVLGRA
jgi:hypothetical protein